MTLDGDENLLTVRNESDKEGTFSLEVNSPFPIVGGYLFDLPNLIPVTFEDITASATSHPKAPIPLHKKSPDPSEKLYFDSAFAQVTDTPTYGFRLHFSVPANSSTSFGPLPRIHVVFQFAEFPLLKLKPGPNTFRVHGDPKDFQAKLQWSAK